MAYAILRAKKLKSLPSVFRSAQHTFRERPTPNADPGLTKNNQSRGARNSSELVEMLKMSLPEKRRRDAVLVIEYLVTASPEAFMRHGGNLGEFGSGYFNDAIRWISRRHGMKNILCSAVHLDETTPHLIVYVVPKTADGRLSCRDFLGGPKMLSSMQDEFYKACGAAHGLERGVVGSSAKHEVVRAFYSSLVDQGAVSKLSRSDYAAAAIGIKTKAWITAEELAQANAIGSERAKRSRKATRSRSVALGAQLLKAEKSALALEAQEDLLNKGLIEIAERSALLDKREEKIIMEEAKMTRIELENEALRRIKSAPLHMKSEFARSITLSRQPGPAP
ncbi:Plasmid recombination enzyme [Acinetobacter baumannii]|nr:Plasmid recombination enzyme [Acinetobacter baumannii]